MKKKTIFRVIASALCSVLFCSCFAACADDKVNESSAGKELTVVAGEYLYRNGVSGYSVVLRDDSNFYEELAANELTMTLEKATGSAISVVKENQLKTKNRVISLGHTNLWDEQVGLTLSSNDIIDSGYYIKTVGNNIFISCPDYTSSSGVLYGVYDLLNDAIDYEFYAEDEIQFTQTKTIPLYDYSGYIVNPSFQLRNLVHAEMRDDTLSCMRYRLSYPSATYGFINWGHGQASRYVKPSAACTCGLDGCGGSFYQHHPDWFSADRRQLCYTGGPELEKACAEKFIEYFKMYPDATYFMFGQEDVVSHCECDRCKQAMIDYGANQGGLQVAMTNNVIEIANEWLEKNQPGRKVKYVIYAYYGTRKAPVKTTETGEIVPYSDEVKPHEDLYVFYTPIEMNYAFQIDSAVNADVYSDMCDWSAITDGRMLMYFYDVNFHAYFVNFNNFTTAKGMYETCKELGISCISSQSADSYVSCFREMRSYVESALLWDLNLSYNDLVKKFMKAYYKDAAPYLYEYYEIMRDRYAYYQNLVNPKTGTIYGEIQTSTLWPNSVIIKIEEQFDLALQSIQKYKETDPTLYDMLEKRIMKERLQPIYLKLTLHASYYSAEEYAELKSTFKYYVNLFLLTELKEGHDFGNLLD